MSEKVIFELSSPGRKGFSLPASDVPDRKPEELIPGDFLRGEPLALPEVSEARSTWSGTSSDFPS
jgi:glycine dehydrogenase subunit 2